MKQNFPCPLCGSLRSQFLYSAYDRMFDIPGEFSIVRCMDCALVSISPMPTFTEVSKYYPRQVYYAYSLGRPRGFFGKLREYLIEHYYQQNFITRMVHIAVPRVPAVPDFVAGGKILDVGCGTGETLILLKRLGWETYGMDIDPNAVKVAKKRGVDHVKVGAYQDIVQYPDNFFDAVRLYHVIEHLDDPRTCLTLIRKKLKMGGQLIIGTPNVDGAIPQLFGSCWYNLDTPRHLVLFSPATLTHAVKQSRFTSIAIEFCSAGGLLGSIQYLIREKFGAKMQLIHAQWLVLLFYPIEWVIDMARAGDVFVLHAKK